MPPYLIGPDLHRDLGSKEHAQPWPDRSVTSCPTWGDDVVCILHVLIRYRDAMDEWIIHLTFRRLDNETSSHWALKDSRCLSAETSEPLQLGEALSSVPVSRISCTTHPIRDPHDGSCRGAGVHILLRPQTNRALPSSQLNEAVTLSKNMMWLYPHHLSAWLVLPGRADGELSSLLILTAQRNEV
jgi:hypothetical protein